MLRFSTTLLTALLAVALLSPPNGNAAGKPNVIIFFADDLPL